MGRNGVASLTSAFNIGEEYQTPKGGRRCVRLRFELPWTALNALPASEGTSFAQSRQGQGGQDGAVYHSTALWE